MIFSGEKGFSTLVQDNFHVDKWFKEIKFGFDYFFGP